MMNRSSMLARYPHRLRFAFDPITGVEIPPEGGAPVVTPPELGFPADTKPTDMENDAQRIAYWKHHSRRHEAIATSRADYDDLKTKAAKADDLEAANASDADKAIALAKAEGKTEGANTYLEVAVRGELRALTGKTTDELSAALDLIDVKKLTLADGGLDLDKITAFAKTLGLAVTEPNEPPTNPGRDALDRISTTPPGGGPSIAELSKQRAAELTPSTTNK